MSLDYFIERFFIVLAIIGSLALMISLGLFAADFATPTEGRVADKYYDDEDLVCAKGCMARQECWTLIIDDQPWWNEDVCVTKSEYDAIDIGDYFKE